MRLAFAIAATAWLKLVWSVSSRVMRIFSMSDCMTMVITS